MRVLSHFTPCALLAALLTSAGVSAAPGTPTPEQEEFFEKQVRPVLAENCWSCHGPEKQKSGLRLDSREALMQGSASTVVVVPGEPDKSPLIQAVKYQGEVHMPPRGKLPDPSVEALSRWVQMGAPWPAAVNAPPGSQPAIADAIEKARREHWAFQPVRKPAAPAVRNSAWARSDLDAFILGKLEEKGLPPAPRADRLTLIRRATFDLHGLPPTPQEVDAFIADAAPDEDAFAKVIDRLLASPRYGERWGRHWLDVARYADTKGYVFNEERRYPYSYTYRDFVIRAFNEDLPYDQFVRYQLAADLMPLGDDTRPLAAMGYLTLGRRFINNIHDIIDDRIDVVSRGMMGLTVTCARCHDHKFDPIPTADYYSLYGVFASSTEPVDKPLIGMPTENAAYRAYEKELGARRQTLAAFVSVTHAALLDGIRAETAAYLEKAIEPKPPAPVETDVLYTSVRDLRPPVVERWRATIAQSAQKHSPVFAPWHALAAVKPGEFAGKVPSMLAELAVNAPKSPESRVNSIVVRRLIERMPSNMKQVTRCYGELLAEIDGKWRTALAASTQPAGGGKAIDKLPDAEEEELRQVLYATGSPTALTMDESPLLFNFDLQEQWRKLQKEVETFQATSPNAPPRAMTLADAAPYDPRIFVRGNPGNPGKAVPRTFLAVLSPSERKPFAKGSGRLELAEAIASRDNPLTARVFVNRVWLHHFGAGLVRTPSDFGTRGDAPTHPELLDYLAASFMENGWSIKKLHRLIMLSSTYQQSSDETEAGAQLDPDNRLVHRMNRRRLDFESMRDAMLASSGRLDLTMGGPSVEMFEPPYPPRRSVYGFIERQNLPPVLRMFDFASPDTSNAQRHQTTVPQQALFLMNSPFVIEQARQVANRTEVQTARDAGDRIASLYRIAFQRTPSAGEIDMGRRFVEDPRRDVSGPPPVPIVWHYGYGPYDVKAGRLVSFTPLPAFRDEMYRGSAAGALPDQELGWVLLNRTGGHPGDDKHAAVRRWVSPITGVVRVSGTLRQSPRDPKCGNGVRGFITSSRDGQLGEWSVTFDKVATNVAAVEVKAGDTIDFVLDSNGDVSCDGFEWAPTIAMVSLASQPAGEPASPAASAATQWDAAANFAPPPGPPPQPLTAWEQYAQVLLMTNEFVFVD